MDNEKPIKTLWYKNKAFTLVILIAVIGALIVLYWQYAEQNTQTVSADSVHTTSYISSVISSIASYRQSAQEETLVAQQYTDKGVDLNNRGVKTAEELAVLMKVTSDFKNGNAYLEQYLNDSNSVISLSAKAINQSATSILQPNEDMLAAYQAGDTKKEELALASATTAQDEGTNNMNDVMELIREGLIFGFGPNDTLPTSGVIHDPLSIAQRNSLLAQIKSDFPNGVNNYSNDIYSLMMYGIQIALVSDTFEQFRSMASAMTTEGAPELPFVVSEK